MSEPDDGGEPDGPLYLAECRIATLEAALKDARYLLGYTVTLDGPDDVDEFFDEVTGRIDELLPGNDSMQRATLETKDEP